MVLFDKSAAEWNIKGASWLFIYIYIKESLVVGRVNVPWNDMILPGQAAFAYSIIYSIIYCIHLYTINIYKSNLYRCSIQIGQRCDAGCRVATADSAAPTFGASHGAEADGSFRGRTPILVSRTPAVSTKKTPLFGGKIYEKTNDPKNMIQGEPVPSAQGNIGAPPGWVFDRKFPSFIGNVDLMTQHCLIFGYYMILPFDKSVWSTSCLSKNHIVAGVCFHTRGWLTSWAYIWHA